MTALKNGAEMVYTIETSKWNGETFLQLSVQDVRLANSEQQTANSEERHTANSKQQSAVNPLNSELRNHVKKIGT